jgi:protein TonB
MKTDLILRSDVLDIIFENRNKAYGAYNLRKFYNNRLFKSLALMLAGVIVLSAFTFIPAKNERPAEELITVMGPTLAEIPPKEKEKEIEKPKEQPQPKKNDVATVKSTTNIKIVPANIDVPPVDAITDSVQISDVTAGGKPGGQPVVGTAPGGEGGEGDGKGKEPATEPAVDIITPTETPDFMPEYPGGMTALRKFLQKHLSNPRDLEENELISVKVRFVVGFDGKLKSFEVAEDGGDEFNKEVIRVLKKMPEWIPGKTRGQHVSVYYTIPVKFVPAQ